MRTRRAPPESFAHETASVAGMGKLIYGSNVDVEIPDLSLLHLDMLLAEHPGRPFQLHVLLSGSEDGDLLSLSIGGGVPLVLKFGNSREDLHIDVDVMVSLTAALTDRGLVSLPMLPAAA